MTTNVKAKKNMAALRLKKTTLYDNWKTMPEYELAKQSVREARFRATRRAYAEATGRDIFAPAGKPSALWWLALPWARMFGVKRESPVWDFPGSPTWREIVTLAAVAGDFDFLRELFRSDSANVAHKDVKLALIDQLLIDR